jgi:4-amino-4-deoxy-L-arabinose transferase-like glycosyltransferase
VNAEPRASGPGARATLALAVLACAVVLGARILGPSDLHANLDQDKTAAFTLDMVENGSWILPVDLMGTPTKKPPLVNWIGAPVVAAGWHTEPAYKAPSVLAGLATVGLIVWAGRRLLARAAGPADAGVAAHAWPLAIAAGAAWLGSPAGVKHIYFLRPDMLFAALLGIAWAAATVALEAEAPRARRVASLIAWVAAGAAALTKGPLALLIPIYALLAARLIHGRWHVVHRTGWWWGVPLMIAPTLVWLALAHSVDPAHVETHLLGAQFGERVAKGTTGLDVLRLLDSCYRIPALSVERFGLWGLMAFVALVMIGPRRWFSHALAPAVLWLLLMLATLVVFANKSGSYLLPMYPASAILGVYASARLLGADRRAPAIIAAVALGIAAAAGARSIFFSRGARLGVGDAAIAFAADAGRVVGEEPVVFVSTGHHPAPLLMGRTRAGQPTAERIERAAWIVMPTADAEPDVAPIVATPTLEQSLEVGGRPADRESGVGLYRADEVRASALSLVAREATESGGSP